jgi:hypothetical protein
VAGAAARASSASCFEDVRGRIRTDLPVSDVITPDDVPSEGARERSLSAYVPESIYPRIPTVPPVRIRDIDDIITSFNLLEYTFDVFAKRKLRKKEKKANLHTCSPCIYFC